MNHQQMVEGYRHLAKEAFANDPKGLESMMRDIAAIERGPSLDEVLHNAPVLQAVLERSSRRTRISTYIMVAAFVVTTALDLYFDYFAKHGFTVRSIATLLALVAAAALIALARIRLGARAFWIVFIALAAAAATWALRY